MIRKFINGRVAVFIDASNIFYSQKTLGWKVDYKKLKRYFTSQASIYGIFFYTGFVRKVMKQRKFLKQLKELEYHVLAKEVKFIKITKDKFIPKGNLDVEMAVDMTTKCEDFDSAVILSGDGDFAYAIDYLKQKRKRVIVISTRGHIARELLKRAKYVDLRKLKKEIEFRK